MFQAHGVRKSRTAPVGSWFQPAVGNFLSTRLTSANANANIEMSLIRMFQPSMCSDVLELLMA